MEFSELGLSDNVLDAVNKAGFETPTLIQANAVPVALKGRDVLGIAQTGTGKTAAFTLPMLARMEKGRARARMPRSLILTPTRELAAQVAEAFAVLGKNHKLTISLLIGGVSFAEQDKKIDRGADVVIATPGRLMDHFQRGKLLLNAIEILVIDEADRMLDMGFIPDVEKICSMLPPGRQTLFFSATMPKEIQRLVNSFLNDPERIEVAPPSSTASTITQKFKYAGDVKPAEKREILREVMRSQEIQNAIVFCNRKRDVGIVYRSLLKHKFKAGALHGDMDQSQRMKMLDDFRAGEVSILAASDVAARGLDIPGVSHVFNYDSPVSPEDYVHRIGRTGRAGREGYAATIVTDHDLKGVDAIKSLIKQDLEWLGASPTDAMDDAQSPTASTGKKGAKESRKPKPDTKGKSRSTGQKSEGKNPGNRKNKTSKDPLVIGMGDHVPAFMTRTI